MCGGGGPTHRECWMVHSPILAWQWKMHASPMTRGNKQHLGSHLPAQIATYGRQSATGGWLKRTPQYIPAMGADFIIPSKAWALEMTLIERPGGRSGDTVSAFQPIFWLCDLGKMASLF